jgi:putative ABC transport system permease protein
VHLWLLWTVRDFRGRWLQIATTGLILAIGIGAFAGLGGMREWRERSADESRAASRAHDVRVDLAEGTFADEGALRAAVRHIPGIAAEERLVAASQVDASSAGRPIVVPARLVGMRPGSSVERLSMKGGTGLKTGAQTAVLDWNFAQHFDLPVRGTVRVAGAGVLRYTGTGVIPQHFLIVGDSGLSGAEGGLATVYAPLDVVQAISGHPGQVDRLVVRGAEGVGEVRLERQVTAALRAALPGVGFTTVRGDDEPVNRMLYRDAANDQKVYWALAVLLLLGAALAAFNLVSRVVEAQRREIGIGMALGAEPRVLALRPLAIGLQIGIVGAIAGVPVGIFLSGLIQGLMRDFVPLPQYASTFPAGLYAAGAALSLLIPVLAAALPVRRAVSVSPVEAIRTGHRAVRAPGATSVLRRLPAPGGAVARLPLRNLARAPRRTVMTVLGLGAVITAVVAVLSMVDALRDVIDRQEVAALSSSPRRMEVTLTGFVPSDGSAVRAIVTSPGVAAGESSLVVGAQARTARGRLPLVIRFVDPASEIWSPTATTGALGAGILLADKAARDLGVAVGDTVVVRLPSRSGSGFTLSDTRLRVDGIHGNPIRPYAYVNASRAASLGLGGIANGVTVLPRPGGTPGALERSLFGRQGVASITPASAESDALRTSLDSFSSAITIVAAITLGLALLVAFTSTSVSVEERRREYATMFAFGLPPRAGVRVAIGESVVTGIFGTIVGVALGLVAASWIVGSLLPDTIPDLGAEVALALPSVITVLVVGVVAVGLAPLLTFRRMRGMDIPSTLRVME